jgi:transglutaminase superfamily protein
VSRTERIARRVRTAVRIVAAFVVVRSLMIRHTLPDLVGTLGRSARSRRGRHHPEGLGRTVAAVLGPLRARCLVTSLVLYRLLREEGYQPELVIGLPDEASSPLAHAWVEVAGEDVGPPPGRGDHRELMRLN